MDDLGVCAYEQLYGRMPRERIVVKYHSGFKPYNANVRKSGGVITFSLSREFEDCEPEIQIGIIQYLFNRLNKTKITTQEQELYHTFLRKMSEFAPLMHTDPVLEESFARCNERYFNGMMGRPNLVWGTRSRALLGTYTYATDTIMISRILEDAPQVLLDSVMYHEMLHKKHKFSCSASGRTHSHTAAFKRDEALFEDKAAERKLHAFLRGARQSPQKKLPSFLERVMGWDAR